MGLSRRRICCRRALKSLLRHLWPNLTVCIARMRLLSWYLCAMNVHKALRTIKAALGLLDGHFVVCCRGSFTTRSASHARELANPSLHCMLRPRLVLARRQHADSPHLQEFAWTYASMQRKQARQVRDLPHVSPGYGLRSPSLLHLHCRTKPWGCSVVCVVADPT